MTTTDGRSVEGPGTQHQLGTGTLVRQIATQVELLVKKQIELARTELRADLGTEARTVGGLGVAAVCALITVNLLLVTAALALALLMPGWAAGLIVSGVTLVTAAIFGAVSWQRRVRKPLARTRQTLKEDMKLKEDVQWTRERLQ